MLSESSTGCVVAVDDNSTTTKTFSIHHAVFHGSAPGYRMRSILSILLRFLYSCLHLLISVLLPDLQLAHINDK